MDKQQLRLSLCSGCAGDYEDPDSSAWDEDPTEEQELIDSAHNPYQGELPETE